MDIHKLRCVVSLAKLRNVTRAAEENYVAQSTMSATISSVEAELGCALFTRTNRSITVTRAGEVFVAAAEDILKRFDGALVELRRLDNEEGPQLVIGFNTVSTGSSIAEMTPAVPARASRIHGAPGQALAHQALGMPSRRPGRHRVWQPVRGATHA